MDERELLARDDGALLGSGAGCDALCGRDRALAGAGFDGPWDAPARRIPEIGHPSRAAVTSTPRTCHSLLAVAAVVILAARPEEVLKPLALAGSRYARDPMQH